MSITAHEAPYDVLPPYPVDGYLPTGDVSLDELLDGLKGIPDPKSSLPFPEVRVNPKSGVKGFDFWKAYKDGRCKLSRKTYLRMYKLTHPVPPWKKPKYKKKQRLHPRVKVSRALARKRAALERQEKRKLKQRYGSATSSWKYFANKKAKDWQITADEWTTYIWPIWEKEYVFLRKWVPGKPYTLDNIYLQLRSTSADEVAKRRAQERLSIARILKRHGLDKKYRRDRIPNSKYLMKQHPELKDEISSVLAKEGHRGFVLPKKVCRPEGVIFDGMEVVLSRCGMLEGQEVERNPVVPDC